MIFPVGDDQVENGYKPVVSYTLIAVNILVYLWQISVGEQAIANFMAVPDEIMRGEDLFAILTSMFMHASIGHLGFNMLFLWIFADNIEATIGSRRFLLFYLLGGAIATLAHVLTDTSSSIPLLGASGAVAAAMGAYMIMFPKNRIKMLFLLGFFRFSIQSVVFLGFWIARELFMGFGELNLLGGSDLVGGGVAYWAHIGGFVFGLIAGYTFKQMPNDMDGGYYIEPIQTRSR